MIASLAYSLIALALKSSPVWTVLLLIILFILFNMIIHNSLYIHWHMLSDNHKTDQPAN